MSLTIFDTAAAELLFSGQCRAGFLVRLFLKRGWRYSPNTRFISPVLKCGPSTRSGFPLLLRPPCAPRTTVHVQDWQEFVDDQGNPYWYSSTTGSSQYENPYPPAWSGDSAVTSGSMVPYGTIPYGMGRAFFYQQNGMHCYVGGRGGLVVVGWTMPVVPPCVLVLTWKAGKALEIGYANGIQQPYNTADIIMNTLNTSLLIEVADAVGMRDCKSHYFGTCESTQQFRRLRIFLGDR